MTNETVTSVTLNDGTAIPQLGYGTLSIQPDREDTQQNAQITSGLVGQALRIGYRHIDTAQSYGTERGVGDAIAASGIPRPQLYVTTKLSNHKHRPDDVRQSFVETLEKLGLEYVDLFLIHWPLPMLYDGDYVSTWRAMVELVKEGRLRSAGVSNFEPEHLDSIIDATGVVPAVNQIEVHPYFANSDACAASRRHGIAVEAWSPLGQGNVLADPVIGRIAMGLGKTPAQIILRWHIQRGNIVIPKSTHEERMKANFELFDFALSDEEVALIDALDRGEEGRRGPHPSRFAGLP